MTTIRADPFAPRLDLRHGDPTRKVAMPIPDLRFEYTYVKSVKSYIHVDRSTGQESSLLDKSEASPSGGEVVRVDWVRVLGVTVRDQLFAPFVQGAIWGMLSMYAVPLIAIYKSRFVAWWQRGETYVPGRRTDGGGVGALRNWVSGLTTAGPKNNATVPSVSR